MLRFDNGTYLSLLFKLILSKRLRAVYKIRVLAHFHPWGIFGLDGINTF